LSLLDISKKMNINDHYLSKRRKNMKKTLGLSIVVTLLSALLFSCQHSGGSKHEGCGDKSKPCAMESKDGQKSECEECKKAK
jgi:hypothetical protein